MNGNKRWWLSAAGAFAFALSLAAGARSDGAVSDSEAAKLVGGAQCTKNLEQTRCRHLQAGCPADILCSIFVDGDLVKETCNPMACGSCGTIYTGFFQVCME